MSDSDGGFLLRLTLTHTNTDFGLFLLSALILGSDLQPCGAFRCVLGKKGASEKVIFEPM